MVHVRLFYATLLLGTAIACRHGRPETDTADTGSCEVPEPMSTVWECDFDDRRECEIDMAGTGGTADAWTEFSNERPGFDGSTYLKLHNDRLSPDPSRDGIRIRVDLSRLCPKAHYSFIGYRSWAGEHSTEEVRYSFGVFSDEEGGGDLSETTVFWDSERATPAEAWFKFGVLNFEATDAAYVYIGSDSVEELWLDNFYIYALDQD